MEQIIEYRPKEFAELINVSVRKLQYWDNTGILKAKRTRTNRRYYTYDQYKSYDGIKNIDDRKDIVHSQGLDDNLHNKKVQITKFSKAVNNYGKVFGRLVINETITNKFLGEDGSISIDTFVVYDAETDSIIIKKIN